MSRELKKEIEETLFAGFVCDCYRVMARELKLSSDSIEELVEGLLEMR